MSHSKVLIAGLSVSIAGAGLFAVTNAVFADDGVGGKVTAPKAPESAGKPDDKGQRIPQPTDSTLAAATGAVAPQRESSGYANIIASWGEQSRAVAEAMVTEYGDPAEASASQLIWHDNGPFVETIVYRDGIAHDFPKPHTDVIEQVIYYRVPLGKIDDLLEFDGSLTVHRTEGTLSARCDDEHLNIMALNLAHDIIAGDKTSDEARQAYAQGVVDRMKKKTPDITEKLLFDAPTGGTGEADKPVKLRIK